jgi:PDZ domain-containing protein
VALFDENVTVSARPRRRMTRATLAGMWALATALVVLLLITFLPTSYVIQQPGPVYNTLGEVAGTNGDVPLIAVSGAETYPTSGTLDLTTVQVLGTRERTPSWFELAGAWFDPTLAVVPIDAVFPVGQSTEERDEESNAMMVDSQQEATAAALSHLGYDIEADLTVQSLADDSPAEGVLEQEDVILAADGEAVTGADSLRAAINSHDGAPVELTIERSGDERTVSVTPEEGELNGEPTWLIGIALVNNYDFPIDVTIQLDNVGGPSAGMMFALGIIDTLTEDDINGGLDIAGTGTITAEGQVGPIGGIRQKLWGAQRAGAQYFLAPADNCDEVVGHVPSGLRVFSVATLDDSIAVLDAVADDRDLDALPACAAP